MDPLAFLYEEKSNDFREIFGEHYIGPDVFTHAESTLIANIKSTHEHGRNVEVYATLIPALSFRIVAKTSHGRDVSIDTGSGGPALTRWCLQTATMLADDVIEIN